MLTAYIIYWYFLVPPTPEAVYNECVRQKVKYPEIVTRQSILETGHYKYYSWGNLFGLYNSNKHEYFEFWSWRQSVKAYRDLVQKKYKGGSYYEFLDNLPYATSENYTKTVKQIKLW